jgi:hypothetical protein
VIAPDQQYPALDRACNVTDPCDVNALKMVAVVVFCAYAEPDTQTAAASVAPVVPTHLRRWRLIES